MEGDAKLQEAGCIHFFKRSFKGSSHDDAPAPKVGAQKYQQDERLMEPDIDVEVKNLAIQLTALTKFNLMEEAEDLIITSMLLKLHSLRLRQQRRQDSLTGKLNKNIVGEEIAIMNVMIVVTLTREVGWNGRQSISVQRFIVG